MRLFSRKKTNEKDGERNNSLTDKVIKVLNYTPVEYTHSPNFLKDGEDPLKDFREKLAHIQLDELCDTMLDPTIESDTYSEVVYGEKQYLYHLNTIIQLTDAAKEEYLRALYIKKVLEEDRERYIQLRNKYIKLQEEL